MSMLGGSNPLPSPHRDTPPPGDSSASGQSTQCLHKSIKASIDAKAATMTAALRDSANDSSEECLNGSDDEIDPEPDKRGRPKDFKRRGRSSARASTKSKISPKNITHTNNVVILAPPNPDEGLIVRTGENHGDWNLAVRETNWRAKFKPRWQCSGFRSEEHFQQALAEQHWEEQIMSATPHKAQILPFRRLDS